MAEFIPVKRTYSEPYPKAFGGSQEHEEGPQEPLGSGLRREKSRINQIRGDTKTLIWGYNDALPLMILDAINNSPTASCCIGKVEKFIRGSGFADKGLENMVIDDEGTTLLQHHQGLSGYLARLEGFSVNFKYNGDGTPRITNAYGSPTESCRFRKDNENTRDIKTIVYNPYFGSGEYAQYQSDEYPVFDLKNVPYEQDQLAEKYLGQMYFYGRMRPPYKFYPVPKYWAAESWIYVDGQIQGFHKENLSNGFFMSTLINVIGDPNEMSQDPRYMKEVTGEDGVVRKEPTKTVGEVFNLEMGKNFSGFRRAGTALVMWSQNENAYVKIQQFPVNSNFDVMSGTLTDAIRGITIATEMPAILANLPQQNNSLGSDGNAMRVAVEIAQANAVDWQSVLEQYYNNVLIPNHVNGSKTAKVKILPYSPFTTEKVINDKIWDWMNDQEKAVYLSKNFPEIQVIRDLTPKTSVTVNPEPVQMELPEVNENLKGLNVREIERLNKIVDRYKKGTLNIFQAQTLLKGYGLSDEQVTAWLNAA